MTENLENKEIDYDVLSDEDFNELKKEVTSSISENQISDEEKKDYLMGLSEKEFEEIVDKFSDQRWRLENLYYIVNEDGEKIQFRPNFIQQEIMHEILDADDDYIRHIILKYRQGGVSTFFTILLLDEFLFSGKNIYNVIIAHERKLLISLFMKIRFALENIDEEFKFMIPKMDRNNANELYIVEYNNRLAISLDVRGETPTRLHITELAWREQKEQQKIITSTSPFRKTKITIESTANGVGNVFYNLCMNARGGKGDYKLLFYPWYIDERNRANIPEGYNYELDEKEKQIQKQYNLEIEQLFWRRKSIDTLLAIGEDGYKTFDQENPDSIDVAFIASGTQVFDLSMPYIINKPEKTIGDFKIYGEPEDKMVFGIDTAEGGHTGDYSTIVGMSRNRKVLFTFRKRCSEEYLAAAIDQIFSLKYKGKHFVGTIQIERNKGAALEIECRKYSWHYLLLKGRDATATRVDNIKEYYGLYMNAVTKNLVITEFRKYLFNSLIEITQDIYEEIATYIYDKGKANAMSGKHDDLLMACMIALNGIEHENWMETYKTVDIEIAKTKYEIAREKILAGKIGDNDYNNEESFEFNSGETDFSNYGF